MFTYDNNAFTSMIYSDQSPVTFVDELPAKVDVVVIGGGVIGVSTAWFLARAGKTVLLCEKGWIAGEQSSRNWGWIRQQGRDAAELPIMMESNRIWQTLAGDLDEDVGFQQQGVTYVAESEEEMEKYRDWVKLAGEHGLESKLLSVNEVRSNIHGFVGDWKGGVVTPSDGRAEPFLAVPAMARGAQKLGVKMIENCAVRGLVSSAGAVRGVVTELGEVACESVVCAAGAWASLFCQHLGVCFPQLTVQSNVARTGPAPEIYLGNAACEDFALRRREDGGYTIAPSGFHEHFINRDSFRFFKPFMPTMLNSWRHTKFYLAGNKGGDVPGGLLAKHWRDDEVSPFELERVLNPLPKTSTVKMIRQRLNKRLPEFKGVPIVECWAGMIDATPDVVPVMDQVASMPGLYLAAGFSGHGFGIGPGAGRVMADMVMGNVVGHDLSRFRLSRFSDGSKMMLGPSL